MVVHRPHAENACYANLHAKLISCPHNCPVIWALGQNPFLTYGISFREDVKIYEFLLILLNLTPFALLPFMKLIPFQGNWRDKIKLDFASTKRETYKWLSREYRCDQVFLKNGNKFTANSAGIDHLVRSVWEPIMNRAPTEATPSW